MVHKRYPMLWVHSQYQIQSTPNCSFLAYRVFRRVRQRQTHLNPDKWRTLHVERYAAPKLNAFTLDLRLAILDITISFGYFQNNLEYLKIPFPHSYHFTGFLPKTVKVLVTGRHVGG